MFPYAQVSLPLHVGYCIASTGWLVLVWRSRPHPSDTLVHTQLAVCRILFVVHVCTVVVYHYAYLQPYTRSLERCQNKRDVARWVAYVSGVTFLQFAQSASLYNIACLLLLRLRQQAKGVVCVGVWWLQVLSIVCALCSCILVVMTLCLMQTRVRCVNSANAGGHATICLNALLAVIVTMYAAVVVDLRPPILSRRICYTEIQWPQ